MTLVIFKRKVDISINWGLISQISNGIWIIFMTIAWCFAWCLCFAITASSTYFHYDGIFKPVKEIRTAENGADIYDFSYVMLFGTICFTFLMLLLVFADMKVDITLYIGLAVSLIHHAGFIITHLLGMLFTGTTKSSTTTLFVGICAGLGLSVCVWAFKHVKNTPELHLVKIECSEV